jgi:hypothetical protein
MIQSGKRGLQKYMQPPQRFKDFLNWQLEEEFQCQLNRPITGDEIRLTVELT